MLSKGPGHFSDLLDASCSVVIYCSVCHSTCSCCFIWLFLSAAAQFADCSHFSPFPIYCQFSRLLTHCLPPSTLITQLLTSTYCCCCFLLLHVPCTSYLSSLTHSHKYCHTLPSLTPTSNALFSTYIPLLIFCFLCCICPSHCLSSQFYSHSALRGYFQCSLCLHKNALPLPPSLTQYNPFFLLHLLLAFTTSLSCLLSPYTSSQLVNATTCFLCL